MYTPCWQTSCNFLEDTSCTHCLPHRWSTDFPCTARTICPHSCTFPNRRQFESLTRHMFSPRSKDCMPCSPRDYRWYSFPRHKPYRQCSHHLWSTCCRCRTMCTILSPPTNIFRRRSESGTSTRRSCNPPRIFCTPCSCRPPQSCSSRAHTPDTPHSRCPWSTRFPRRPRMTFRRNPKSIPRRMRPWQPRPVAQRASRQPLLRRFGPPPLSRREPSQPLLFRFSVFVVVSFSFPPKRHSLSVSALPVAFYA